MLEERYFFFKVITAESAQYVKPSFQNYATGSAHDSSRFL